MRNLFLLTSIFFSSFSTFAQDHVPVYRWGLLGAAQLEKGHPDSAEPYLLKALDLMTDKSMFPYYYPLIGIAWKHHESEKLKRYFRELSCVYTRDTLYAYIKEYGKADIDPASFDRLYFPRCTLKSNRSFAGTYPYAVDSILRKTIRRDQAVRDRAHHLTDTSAASVLALKKEMNAVNDSDFDDLYYCIKTYGFPRIDFPLAGSRITLIDHIDDYNHFKKIQPYLLKAVDDGLLNPANYAYSMDRSLAASGLRPKYFWFITGTEYAEKWKPSDKELATVNNERAKIGLPPYPVWIGWGF